MEEREITPSISLTLILISSPPTQLDGATQALLFGGPRRAAQLNSENNSAGPVSATLARGQLDIVG